MSWKTTLQVIATVYIGIGQAGAIGTVAYHQMGDLWSLLWAVPGCLMTAWAITAMTDLERRRS